MTVSATDSGKGGSRKGHGPQRQRVTTDGEGESDRGNGGWQVGEAAQQGQGGTVW